VILPGTIADALQWLRRHEEFEIRDSELTVLFRIASAIQGKSKVLNQPSDWRSGNYSSLRYNRRSPFFFCFGKFSREHALSSILNRFP
jgi:hypothetical protein